jgi:hypothetical protein
MTPLEPTLPNVTALAVPTACPMLITPVFWLNVTPVPPESAARAPASVKPTAVEEMVKVKRAPASVKQQTDAFESSLVDQYKKQMRHSDEVNQLIRDLKNYEMDYDTGY